MNSISGQRQHPVELFTYDLVHKFQSVVEKVCYFVKEYFNEIILGASCLGIVATSPISLPVSALLMLGSAVSVPCFTLLFGDKDLKVTPLTGIILSIMAIGTHVFFNAPRMTLLFASDCLVCFLVKRYIRNIPEHLLNQPADKFLKVASVISIALSSIIFPESLILTGVIVGMGLIRKAAAKICLHLIQKKFPSTDTPEKAVRKLKKNTKAFCEIKGFNQSLAKKVVQLVENSASSLFLPKKKELLEIETQTVIYTLLTMMSISTIFPLNGFYGGAAGIINGIFLNRLLGLN